MFEHIRHPQQRSFLAAYSECGIVKRAAKIAGISRELHYDWKAKDTDYAEAFAWAVELAGDALEDEAVRRAQLGVKEHLLYQGEIVTVPTGKYDAEGNPIRKPLMKRRYSDGLLAQLLGGAKPEKYRTKTVEHKGEVKHKHEVDLSGLDDSELDALERILGKARIENHARGDRGGTPETPAE
jgi:hypothetical protein